MLTITKCNVIENKALKWHFIVNNARKYTPVNQF